MRSMKLYSIALVAVGVCCLAAAGENGWPDWRGPWQNGVVRAVGTSPVGLPLQWSETENVKWKTPIPLKGWSSPVVMDNQIWLTTATEDGHDFYAICVDAGTGEIKFNEKLFHSDNPESLGNEVNGYASPSPVIEPGRVYVHFGSYGTACLDTATCKVIWQRTDLPCRHFRGPGSSPILFENSLILTFDGVDVEYTTALDKKSGKTVWKTDRTTQWRDLDENGKPKREGDFRKAFSTPFIIDAGGGNFQMISPGSWATYAYDPRTGREIWKTHNDSYTPAACAVSGNGLAYVITGNEPIELWAMRLDGTGDVTDTHVAWKLQDQYVPQIPSPVFADGLLYMTSSDGMAMCVDAATGKPVWTKRIGGSYYASPIYADGRVYFFSVQGKSTVLKAGNTGEVLAANRLDTGMMASAAVSGKALFLRTKTHLYRIEAD
jgi:outer membrane protein assembly factor BamB